MRSFIKSIASVALGLLVLVPMAANASTLTSVQVSAIVSLLQSFGADSHTVSGVEMVLSGRGDSSPPHFGTTTPIMHADPLPMGTSTPPSMGMPPGYMGKLACIVLSRNLGVGSKGDDVKNLQQMLSEDKDSGFSASPTGFFGPATAKAMATFQLKNGIASSTSGTVGALTRGFFERRCGQGMGDDHRAGTSTPPMINGDEHHEGPGMPGTMGTSTNPRPALQPMQYIQAH